MLSPITQKILVVAGVFVGIGFISAGFYVAIDSAALYSLKEKANIAFSEGNYASAVASFGDISKRFPEDIEAMYSFEKAKKLLIANEDFSRARAASIAGDKLLVYALLNASDAAKEEAFIYFEEAKRMLNEATASIIADENAMSAQIIGLKKQVEKETENRVLLEAQKTKTEENLASINTAKQQTESELKNAKNELEKKAAQISAQEQKISEERARANEIAAQIESERNQKFISDLKNYTGMIVSGEDKLRIGAAELSSGNDITSLFYVGQAKTILEEARNVGDLRGQKVPSDYIDAADTALRGVVFLEEAAIKLKSASAFIDEQNSDFYSNFINDYQISFDKGVMLRQEVEQFISQK